MSDYISKDSLLQQCHDDEAEDFEINTHGKKGKIRIRGFRTTKELDDAGRDYVKLNAQKSIIPELRGKSDEELQSAIFLSYCIVEPKLSVDECFKLGDTIGPVSRIIFGRIMELSGFTKNMMEKMEEKLRNDPFPANGSLNLSGSSAPSSLGGGTVHDQLARNNRVSANKRQGTGKSE